MKNILKINIASLVALSLLILAISQDELAIPTHSAYSTKNQEIFVKNLKDGSVAIGLFNLSEANKVLTFN